MFSIEYLKSMDGKSDSKEVMEVEGYIISTSSEFDSLAEVGQLSKKTIKKGFIPNTLESWVWKFEYNRFGDPALYKTKVSYTDL